MRDEQILSSINAALNFIIRDYRRLHNEHQSVLNAISIQSAVKVTAKVDNAKA